MTRPRATAFMSPGSQTSSRELRRVSQNQGNIVINEDEKWEAPRYFWPDHVFPNDCVVTIVYEMTVEIFTERQVNVFITTHVGNFGKVESILVESTDEPLWKKFLVHCSSLDVGKFRQAPFWLAKVTPEYRLFFKPLTPQAPEEEMRDETEVHLLCENFRLDLNKLPSYGLNIRVLNPNRLPYLDFLSVFKVYGSIISLEDISSEGCSTMNIQFLTVAAAHAASNDPNHQSIRLSSGRPQKNLIVFYLSKQVMKEAVKITLRELSTDVQSVVVDRFNSRAIYEFESLKDAEIAFEKMKTMTYNFGDDPDNYKIAVDYCCTYVKQEFIRHRDCSQKQHLKTEKIAFMKAQQEKKAKEAADRERERKRQRLEAIQKALQKS